MTRDELIKQCRYYKGEEECPFDRGSIDALWWSGERSLSDNVFHDKSFFQRLKDSLEDALTSGECSGALIDSSIPLEKRAIIFYLDLWHGKNFPYDDLDIIRQYLPTP